MGSLQVALRAALQGNQAGIWTALPAYATAFDPNKVTVSAQPTVQAQVRTPGGTWINTTLPLCVDCPVHFPGGGGYSLTFPIADGDEGILVFASRCIDAWWQNSGVQPQAELRMHDLSDGFFLPLVFSNPKVPAGGVSTTNAQLRSADGTTHIDLMAGGAVEITAPGGITFNGPVTFLSTVGGTGGIVNFGSANIHTTGDLKTGGVASVNGHIHGGVATGGGDTGPPTG